MQDSLSLQNRDSIKMDIASFGSGASAIQSAVCTGYGGSPREQEMLAEMA